MKKILLSVFVMLLANFSAQAQWECNDDLSAIIGGDGTGQILVSDLVPDIEFMLTQGTVTYFIAPTYGVITSSADLIPLTCENRGVKPFIVELEANGDLLWNCTGEIVITSPNGGCPGSAPAYCDEEGVSCTSFVDSYSFLNFGLSETLFAIDFALCEDLEGCNGTYSIAIGSTSDDPGTLDFGNSISTENMTTYQNPVVLSYTDEFSTILTQAYVYIWEYAECILTAEYKTNWDLSDNADLIITPEDIIMYVFDECENTNVTLSLTEVIALNPATFTETLTLGCDDLGERRIWVKNNETGYVLSKIITIKDPTESCGTVLQPGERLLGYSNEGPSGFFFNHDVLLNGSDLPRHPSGIGWIMSEDDLIDGENVIEFNSKSFSLNGVSTLDLVLGLRIILLDEYNDNFEPVLFDIDQSGYDGIADLIGMREIILGISDGSQYADAYFFNNSYEFPSDFNPFDFDNNFTEFRFDKADYATTDFSFEVFKVGDLNETAIPGFQEKAQIEVRSGDLGLLVPDMEVEEGEQFTFTLKYSADEKFKGLLTALIGDKIDFLDMTFDDQATDFNVINDNEIRISYYEPNATAVLDEISFEVSAKANKSGKLVDLLGLKSGFPHEVVGGNNEVVIIEGIDTEVLLSVNIVGVDTQVEVFPNPVVQNLFINADEGEITKAEIFNVIGQKVLTRNLTSSNSIDVSNLSNGIYYMNVSTEDGVQRVSFVKE